MDRKEGKRGALGRKGQKMTEEEGIKMRIRSDLR